MDLFIEDLALGAWQANCYVLGDRDAGRAVVVDPGQGASQPVRAILDRNDVAADAILLTHGHIDHLWSAPALSAALDAPVLLHDDDRWLWRDPLAALPPMMAAQVTAQLDFSWTPASTPTSIVAGQRLALGGLRLEVRHTPGHTPGSCVFLLDGRQGPTPVGPGLLLAGDLIFAGSVGRTDFPRGSHSDLLASIRDHVLDLPDAAVIASGHGPRTTVGAERAANPFLTGL